MRTRDPEAKKQQLIEGALSEFAEHGLAGARVDRIAERAGISPGLVYSFHGGKAELFEAVFEAIVAASTSLVPLDADHLPEYAASLYDTGLAYPEVGRFLRWFELERGDIGANAAASTSMAHKVTAIKAAQRRGTVTSVFTARELLALVLTIANMWGQSGEDVRTLVPAKARRALVVNAVQQLISASTAR